MIECSPLTSVPIDSIDIEDKTFIISYPVILEELVKSIESVGLMHPVLLRYIKKENRYQVILGYKRVCALMKLGVNKADAFIVDDDNLTPFSALLYSINDTVSIRSLNHVEKSICIKKLLCDHGVSQEEMFEKYLFLIDVPPSKKIMADYIAISQFSDLIKDYIVNNGLTLSNSILFKRFNERDQDILLSFFLQLNLGMNKLKGLFFLIEEVCLRDEISVAKLLGESEIKEILTHDKLSLSQKTQKVFTLFEGRRYPNLFAMTKKVLGLLHRFNLPDGVKISYPPFFEGETWKVDFSFVGKDDFKLKTQALFDLSKAEELEEVIEIVWDDKDV